MILIDTFFNSFLSGIIGSVIASFLTIAIIEIYRSYKNNFRKSKFKKIFGSVKDEKLCLILPLFQIRPEITKYLIKGKFLGAEYPLINSKGDIVKSSRLLANCDTRGLKYLSDTISDIMDYKAQLITDYDLGKKLDLSFICFGSTNFYCSQILDNDNNRFYRIDGSMVVNLKTQSGFPPDAKHDIGTIIKLKHKNFPNRTWITIAGINETGTSGAAWYLSTHWDYLSKMFGNKEFGLVIKVEKGIDESATMIDYSND